MGWSHVHFEAVAAVRRAAHVHQNRLRTRAARGLEQRNGVGNHALGGVRRPGKSHDALLQIDDHNRGAARLKNQFAHQVPPSLCLHTAARARHAVRAGPLPFSHDGLPGPILRTSRGFAAHCRDAASEKTATAIESIRSCECAWAARVLVPETTPRGMAGKTESFRIRHSGLQRVFVSRSCKRQPKRSGSGSAW